MANLVLVWTPAPMLLAIIGLLVSLIPLAIIIGLIVFAFRYRNAVKQANIKIAKLENELSQLLKNHND